MDTTKLLQDLVALPSVNPMGRDLRGPDVFEHRVTAYLEEFFRGLGVRCERQTVAPGRDNILAWYEPAGARRTLILEVHQDTVPTDGMTVDPFAARIDDGRLYGRGACDVKGGMAAMLTAFARLVRDKPAGAARVVMACTVDEEYTFLGVQKLAKTDWGGGPVEAVVAEPTGLDVVHAHKGAVRWDVVTHGRSCHSSRPEVGVNAIYHMAALLPHIERFADDLRRTRIDPLLGPATLSVGRIEGGVSVNTVPDRCRIEIDRRILPGEDAATAAGQLHAHLRDGVGDAVSFSFSEPWLSAPALAPEGSADLVRRLLRAAEPVAGKRRVTAVPYGTDAAPLAQSGVPCVVFGPGDIARAHTCDEWVPLEEVAQAAEILHRLALLD
ncbi:MAG TPA: M20 family metallopeptidase [Gemmataceae bacterium]|nr:M20 family metallopeptidase [Gemmataceae bacterium]